MEALEPEAVLAKRTDLDGLFLKTPDKRYILIRLDAPGQRAYAPVYHDYVHYLASGAADWMPLWMNEGLAEFFQNIEIHEKDAELGQPNSEQITLLRQNKLLPLKVLLAADTSSPIITRSNGDRSFMRSRGPHPHAGDRRSGHAHASVIGLRGGVEPTR